MWWVCRLSHHMPSSFLIWKENMKNAHLIIFHICKFAQLQIYTIAHLHNCKITHLQIAREKAIKKFPAAIAATFSWPQQVVLFVTFFYIWQSFSFSDSVCCKYTPAMGRIHRRVSADWFWSLLSLFLQFHFRFSLDFKITCCFQFLQQREEAPLVSDDD